MQEEYILNVKVNFLSSWDEVLNKTITLITDPKFNYVCTTNPEFILSAENDSEFKYLVNNSDLSLPDGSGLLFAKKYYEITEVLPKGFYALRCLFSGVKLGLGFFLGNVDLEKKFTGVEYVERLCSLAAAKNYSVYLLGGWPKSRFGKPLVGDYNVAGEAASYLKEKYPGLNVVGTSSKYSYKKEDDKKNLNEIYRCMKDNNLEHIDIILVAYGHGSQEKWLVRNGSKIPVSLGVGVGGTFDYFAGYVALPNEYIKSLNIEWLFRLFTQPWRISRIFNAFPVFPLKVFLSSIKQK